MFINNCLHTTAQELGTVCYQKWRLQSACEHLRLNLRLIPSLPFLPLTLKLVQCHWHFFTLNCIVCNCFVCSIYGWYEVSNTTATLCSNHAWPTTPLPTPRWPLLLATRSSTFVSITEYVSCHFWIGLLQEYWHCNWNRIEFSTCITPWGIIGIFLP